jgi:hypothetical protein
LSDGLSLIAYVRHSQSALRIATGRGVERMRVLLTDESYKELLDLGRDGAFPGNAAMPTGWLPGQVAELLGMPVFLATLDCPAKVQVLSPELPLNHGLAEVLH